MALLALLALHLRLSYGTGSRHGSPSHRGKTLHRGLDTCHHHWHPKSKRWCSRFGSFRRDGGCWRQRSMGPPARGKALTRLPKVGLMPWPGQQRMPMMLAESGANRAIGNNTTSNKADNLSAQMGQANERFRPIQPGLALDSIRH